METKLTEQILLILLKAKDTIKKWHGNEICCSCSLNYNNLFKELKR